MSSRLLSTQDVVFRRALLALPQPLRDALAEAELDDPGPRDWRTLAAFGLTQKAHEEGRRRQRYGRCWCSAGHRGGYGYEYCARMAGSTDTLVGGTMELSSISGAVPVVFPSSFSFFPSLSSPLPVVSAGVMPEEGPETLVLGTSGAGQDSKVSIETTESPSGGNVETEKRVPEVESGLALSCREGM